MHHELPPSGDGEYRRDVRYCEGSKGLESLLILGTCRVGRDAVVAALSGWSKRLSSRRGINLFFLSAEFEGIQWSADKC